MPELHQIGKHHFVHAMKYPTTRFPLIDRGDTQEIEDPYRYGRSLVMRLPFARSAFVVGRWTGEGTEDSGLRRAIGARDLDVG